MFLRARQLKVWKCGHRCEGYGRTCLVETTASGGGAAADFEVWGVRVKEVTGCGLLLGAGQMPV